ncbi:MAG: AMP-binding protein [Okeania sp. SIO3B3]|nr:AMP-binding protein [Okeania sp. SIO3B3]
MKIVEFISYLQNLGVKLWIEQEQLGCDAPKGVITPELKQNLIARKKEIIEFLRQGYNTQEQFIKQVSRDGKLPLSFAQERLWFLNQLFPNNPAYNLPIVLTIDGTLNVVALEQSLNAIIQRHETLRTTFSDIDGKPVQIVAPVTDLTLPVVDLQNNNSPQEQSEKVQQLVRQEAMTLFDLANGPMLRVTLLRLDPERYVLLMTMHHIMCDLWSLGILVKELSSFYAAFSQGKTSIFPELPIQYADFAYWQREWFAGEVLEKQLNYWKKQLTGVSPVLKLPTDYPHPAQPTFKSGSKSFQIELDLTRKLRQLSQESESTLFMTLLSAFFVLLSRYSGQLDLVVGSPIANRNRGEIESLIGMFVNTLVLRADLSDNPTFQELLNQVRETTLEAYAHQDFPFEKLVEQLKIERNLSHNPLVQVAIALQNTKMESWNLPGLRVNQRLDSDFTRFDLEVHLMEVSSGLEVYCNYSRDIFEPDTIDRMMKHFQVLLEAVVTHPEQRVLQLPLMTEVELEQILVEWNDTITDYPTDKCIHQLFEEQVEKTPDAVAVIFEGEQLTYQQLNYQANQLAHYLQSLGVKPEVLVGICVERSVEMVIGLLGILKAGGAYVPLDPNYPTSRLNYMVEDAQLSILLTQQKWQHHLPQIAAQVICLDADIPNTVTSENLKVSITSEHQAYMMYTSGSTGLPKGVNIRHQGVVRLVKNTNYINLTEKDIFLQLAPISFDAATFEIWGSLLNGGTLVVMPPHQPSLTEIGVAITKNQVTTLWLSAGLFQLMVEEQLENLKSLKQLLAGGEILSVTHVQKCSRKTPRMSSN